MTSTIEIVAVPVELVDRSPYQRRTHFPEAAEAELAESVREHGVIQPLVMRMAGERYELVAGERRWRAAKAAGLPTVPAIVRELTDKEACAICVVENVQRQNLTLLEEAESFEAMVQAGFEVDEVAQRVGKDRAYVWRRRDLLKLGAEPRRAVDEGRMSLHTAVELVRLPVEDAEKAFEELCKRGMAEGNLPERVAMQVLKFDFMEPAKRRRAWEAARKEVEKAFPGAKWQGWDEAWAADAWSSPLRRWAERPLAGVLSSLGREEDEKDRLPTWGELAGRCGHLGVIGASEVDDDEREEASIREALEEQGWKFLEGDMMRACRMVDPELVIEGELARCEAESLPCIFRARGGESLQEGEDEKREKAEEAARKREEAREVAAEKKKLLEAVLAGELSVKKQAELAIVAHEVAQTSWDFFWDVAKCLGWIDPADHEDDEMERYERKMAAAFRKPDGGFWLLGALVVADVLCEQVDAGYGEVAAAASRLKLLPEAKYPHLAATAAQAAARQDAKGGTLQEEC